MRSTSARVVFAVLIVLGVLVLPHFLGSDRSFEAELIPPAVVEKLDIEAVPGTASVLSAAEARVVVTTLPPANSTTTAPARLEDLPTQGSSDFTFATTPGRDFGVDPNLEFAVATEDGTGIDADDLAAFVDATLSDPRSWIGDGTTGLRRVQSGGDFTLVIATPETVDRLCAPLQTNGYLSCARNGFVVLNLHRWATATEEWTGTIELYRQYLINHEVGHYLVGPGHETCPGDGELAPLMMQQTKGLDGCEPNGWVFPR